MSRKRFGVLSECLAGFHRPSRFAFRGSCHLIGTGSESWMPVTT